VRLVGRQEGPPCQRNVRTSRLEGGFSSWGHRSMNFHIISWELGRPMSRICALLSPLAHPTLFGFLLAVHGVIELIRGRVLRPSSSPSTASTPTLPVHTVLVHVLGRRKRLQVLLDVVLFLCLFFRLNGALHRLPPLLCAKASRLLCCLFRRQPRLPPTLSPGICFGLKPSPRGIFLHFLLGSRAPVPT